MHVVCEAPDPAGELPRCRLCSQTFKLGTGRGPGGTACSRNKCREQLYGLKDKDARLKEMEERLAEKDERLAEKDAFIKTQAALIALLKQQSFTTASPPPQRGPALSNTPPLAVMQQPAVVRQPAAAVEPVDRQPSTNAEACAAAGEKRSQPSAPAPAKRKPLNVATQRAGNGATATTAVWAEGEGLLPTADWSERYSSKRKCWVYEYRIPLDGSKATLTEKPRLTTNGAQGGTWHVHHMLVVALYDALLRKTGPAPSMSATQREYEAAMGLDAGCIASSKSHDTVFRRVFQIVEEEQARMATVVPIVPCTTSHRAGIRA